MALKTILTEARAKIVAEKQAAINVAVEKVTNNVISPKFNELETAKVAAITEKEKSYKASVEELHKKYEESIAALKTEYETSIASLRTSCEEAKAAFKESEIAKVTKQFEETYATKLAELDKLISSSGDTI